MIMNFTKIINVSNLLIIFLMIINDESNANDCINQITNNNIIRIDSTGTDAFKNAFLYSYNRVTCGDKKHILRQYLEYLYNQVALIFRDDMCLKPMDWCMNNTKDFDTPIQDDQKKLNCEKNLSNAGFDNDCNAREALRHIYFEITTKTNLIKPNNEIVNTYSRYMIYKILPDVAQLNLKGPQFYCNNYTPLDSTHYYIDYYQGDFQDLRVQYCFADCINEMTRSGLPMNYNGLNAFKHAYFHLLPTDIKNIKGRSKKILRQYFNDLFVKATLNFKMQQRPIDWCLGELTKHAQLNTQLYDKVIKACEGYFARSGFDSYGDTKEALKCAYFKMIYRKTNLSQIEREYTEYIFNTFIPHINLSQILGPQQYCHNTSIDTKSVIDQDYSNIVGYDRYYNPYTDLQIQLANTLTDGQSNPTGNNLSNIDQYQTGSFGVNVPVLQGKSNLPLESTSAVAHDATTSSGIGTYQALNDFSGVVIPDSYFGFPINVHPSPELFAGGNINTTITNQFGSGPNPPDAQSQDAQSQEMISGFPANSFSPYMFISTPNQDDFNDLIEKPSDYN